MADTPGTQQPFASILFPPGQAPAEAETPEPPYFHDLNLDRVVAAVTAGKQEYHLAPFLYAPLHDPGAIVFRQEVMRDMENEALAQAILDDT